jgi:hypothetical protein
VPDGTAQLLASTVLLEYQEPLLEHKATVAARLKSGLNRQFVEGIANLRAVQRHLRRRLILVKLLAALEKLVIKKEHSVLLQLLDLSNWASVVVTKYGWLMILAPKQL